MASFGLLGSSGGDGNGGGGADKSAANTAPQFSSTSSSTTTNNVLTMDASTPFLAASEGDVTLLEQSLQYLHAPVTIQDENGYTLLHAAASYNQPHIIQYLLSQISSSQVRDDFIETTDHEGDSVLHYASTSNVAKLLVGQIGKQTNLHRHVNASGKTALQAKQDELHELLEEKEDNHEEDEEVETLKELIDYLSNLS